MNTVKQSLTSILIVLLCTFMFNVPMVMAETEIQTATDVTTQTTDQTTGQTTDPKQILDENGQPVDPGILPDSPFYWWDQLMKQIKLALAWTPEQQADVLQEQALENMAEAVVMTEEGQPEDAEIAMNKYLETVSEVKSLIETLKDPSSQEAQNLLTAISAKNASNIQVLGNLILSEKLPPQAAEQIFINAVKKITKCMDKLDHQAQIQLKKNLRETTEELGDVDLDEETETVLEDRENIEQDEQTEQTDQTTDTNTDIDDDQVDNTSDTEDTDVTTENNKKENKQEAVTGQDNGGQINKEQNEEKNNNINNDVNEDGQDDQIQNENNQGSGKNNDGGKGKKH